MHKIKKVILIVVAALAPIVSNAYCVDEPAYEFKSTSKMLVNSETKTTLYSIGAESPYNSKRYAKSIGDEDEGPGYKPHDPSMPVGNPIIPLLLFAAAYCYTKKERH